MSIRDQIASLERLAAIDNTIRRIDDELGKQRDKLEGMQSDVKGLEGRIKTDRETLAQIEKTRSELMIELRQMTQQIDRSREKLQRSRNERESNAAQREIEELRKLHRDREEEIERLTAAADAARTSIDEADQKRSALAQVLEGSTEGAAQSLSDLEAERKVSAASRERVVKELPVVLYRRYESIRTRRPYAIAKTHDGTCNGCHIAIPPMMYQHMLRQEQFEQCPNCRRLLYYVPLEQQQGDPKQDGGSASKPTGARAPDPSRI